MKDAIFCPSAVCRPNALLLGVVMGNGRIFRLDRPPEINEDFVQIAQRGRRPEKRFRFASPCLESSCQQWSDGRCTVIDRCSETAPQDDSADIPKCSIRSRCRWFRQNGPVACRVCPQVITDASESWAHVIGDSKNVIDPVPQ